MLSWDQYAVAWAGLHGSADPRRMSPVVRGWLRLCYRCAALLGRLRLTPAVVTALGLLVSLAVPVVAAAGGGWPVLAAALVVLAALADTVDGALAVATGRASRLGYVYDSLADRIAEAAWLAGLVVVGVPGWLAVLCGALSWLHEYLRARATAAGMAEVGVVTVAERPTRVILATGALALAGLAGGLATDRATTVATVVAAVWVLLAAVGLVRLLLTVHRRLAGRRWSSQPDDAPAGRPDDAPAG